VDGKAEELTWKIYRDTLIASYEKVSTTLAFTDPHGSTWSVRFDDLTEELVEGIIHHGLLGSGQTTDPQIPVPFPRFRLHLLIDIDHRVADLDGPGSDRRHGGAYAADRERRLLTAK